MRHGKPHCTAHYISLDQISELVLADIRHHAQYAVNLRQEYHRFLRQLAEIGAQEDLKKAAKDCEKAKKRIKVLDDIIKKLLEQNAVGRISDERFFTLSAEYESEQTTLKEQVCELEMELSKAQERTDNTEQFVGLIDKYINIQSLNARILNELIDRIVVHDREMIDGERHQQVDIYYKFIGLANIYV